MSVYNSENFLNVAIDSIIQQTYKNWELIICNDGSTDSSWEILKSYKKRFNKKIKIFQNTENKKLAYSLNECLKRSSGELIARMDADDISLPNRLELQFQYLLNNPHIDLVGSQAIKFDENSHSLIHMKRFPSKKLLLKTVPFLHPTILTYKYVFDAVSGYTVKKRTEIGQDYDLWFKFFSLGFIGHNIDEPLYWYRKTNNAMSSKSLIAYLKYDSKIISTKLIGFMRLKFPLRYYIYTICIHIYLFVKFLIRKVF